MWDLPRPGLDPVSPALAGRFSTPAPPGKPLIFLQQGIFFLAGSSYTFLFPTPAISSYSQKLLLPFLFNGKWCLEMKLKLGNYV